MAIENPVTGAILVLGGPAGLPGAVSTVPGPSGPPGAASTVPGPQGQPGPGTLATRTATTDILPSTYVVDQPGDTCAIADPTNMDHQGKVLGLVVAGATQGQRATIQYLGSMSDVSGSFFPGNPLYIGDGTTARVGSIVNRPPVARSDIDVWEQQVGTATTTTLINGALGLPIRIPKTTGVALTISSGGFAARATDAEASDPTVADKWISPSNLGAVLLGIFAPYVRRDLRTIYLADYLRMDGADTSQTRAAETARFQAAISDATRLYGNTDGKGVVFRVPPGFGVLNAGALQFPTYPIIFDCMGPTATEMAFRGQGDHFYFPPSDEFGDRTSHVRFIEGMTFIPLEDNPSGHCINYEGSPNRGQTPTGAEFENIRARFLGSAALDGMIRLNNGLAARIYNPHLRGPTNTVTQVAAGLILDGISTNVRLEDPDMMFADKAIALVDGAFAEGLQTRGAVLIYCNFGIYGHGGTSAPWMDFQGHCETFQGAIDLVGRSQVNIKDSLFYKSGGSTANYVALRLASCDRSSFRNSKVSGLKGASGLSGTSTAIALTDHCNGFQSSGIDAFDMDLFFDGGTDLTSVSQVRSTVTSNVTAFSGNITPGSSIEAPTTY